MLILALEMTPQLWHLVVLAIAALGGGACVWLEKTKRMRAERITHAVFAGARAGVKDLELGKDDVTALEDAIREAARDYDVEEHVEQHLGEGLAQAAPAKG